METRRGAEPLITISMAFLLLFVGSGECAEMSFSECYGAKYTVCALTKSRVYCAGMAMSECARTDNRRFTRYLLSVPPVEKRRYCELGCAITQCSQLDPSDMTMMWIRMSIKMSSTIRSALTDAEQQAAKCFKSCSVNSCKPKTSSALTKTVDDETNDGFCKLGCAISKCGAATTDCESCVTTCS